MDIIKPKVSIVISVFNNRLYIKEAYNSVSRQTYDNIEIIIVDDGSTDGSGDLCEELTRKDAKAIVYHKKHGGIPDARNYGMSKASGKYIYFLDGDAWIENCSIEILVDQMEKSSLDVLFFDGRCVDKVGNELIDDKNYRRYYRVGDYETCTKGRLLLKQLVDNNELNPVVSMMILKKDSFNFNFENIVFEDELYIINVLSLAEKAGYYPGIFCIKKFKTPTLSVSRKIYRRYEDIYYLAKKIADISDENGSIKKRMQLLYSYVMNTYCLLDKNDKNKCKNICTKLKELYKNIVFKDENIKEDIYYLLDNLIDKRVKKYCEVIYNKAKLRVDEIRALSLLSRRVRDNGRVVFLVGTPKHGNLGDHLIAMVAKDILSKAFPKDTIIEVEKYFYERNINFFKRIIRHDDIIVINGGGWMGNQWPANEILIENTVASFKNHIIVLPQTIYYEKKDGVDKDIIIADKIYSNKENLRVLLREKASYDFAIKHKYSNCALKPDLALYYKYNAEEFKREGVLVISRDDREKAIPDKTWDMVYKYLSESNISFHKCRTNIWQVPPEKRNITVKRKLKEFAQAKLVITDRLHAMIFAAITGTPCIAFDNTSKKVSGVAKWLSDLSYIAVIDDTRKIGSYIDELYNMKQQKYICPNEQELIDFLARS